MFTEDYISGETAKLLKEKGFDWEESPFYSEQDKDEWKQNNNYTIPNTSYNPDLPFDSETITLIAPHVSLQMAMKWLRKKHNLYVTSVPNGIGEQIFYPLIYKNYDEYGWIVLSSSSLKNGFQDTEFSSPEKACEATIKYCLENLI